MITNTEAVARLDKAWTGVLRAFGFLWLIGSLITALVLFMAATNITDNSSFTMAFYAIVVLAQGILGYALCDVLSATALGVRASLERLAALERWARASESE